MGKTNKCNLFNRTCKKYQYLYDKSFSGYKERDRYKDAWKIVGEEIGLEEISYC